MSPTKKSGSKRSAVKRSPAIRRSLGRTPSTPINIPQPTIDAEDIFGARSSQEGGGRSLSSGVPASSGDLSEDEQEIIRRKRQKKSLRSEKERQRQREVMDKRVNYILPPDLKAQLQNIAGELKSSQSSVVTFLAYYALADIQKNGIKVTEYLKDYLVASDNIHWQFQIVHPDDPSKKAIR